MNVASIDIGTNTVILLIAKINISDKSITTILNEYQMPRLGKGLLDGQPLPEENIARLYRVFDIYSGIISKHDCSLVIANGTSALRRASNSDVVIKEIRDKYGIEINVISGEEEARLSYLGAVTAADNSQYTVIDIGGGSTEIISGFMDRIEFKKSFHAGVVSLTERFIGHNPPLPEETAALEFEIRKIFAGLGSLKKEGLLVSLAGTPTTLACIKAGLKEYDEEIIEGSRLSRSELRSFVDLLSSLSTREITEKFGAVTEGRSDLILCGAAILFQLMDIMDAEETLVSAKGLRYGAVTDFISKSYRDL
ncbi:MAG: hypothetical protein ACM3Q2_11465 [Syntrophothermus sp.]